MKKNILKWWVLVLFLSIAFNSAFGQTDFSTIASRIRGQYYEEINEQALLKNTVAYLPLLKNDGSWPDIDYANTAITKWPPGVHLDRVKSLAIALTKDGSFYFENTTVWEAVVKGLRYWIFVNPKSQNWWHNEIATPQALGEIILLMQASTKTLPTDLQDSLVQRMKKGNVFEKTGANKLDIALHMIYRACITKDKALMDTAVSQAFYPISFTTEEGLQYDYSYLQHGAQLQISSYGFVFLSGEYKVASWMKGTSYALKGEQLKLLNHYFVYTFLPAIRGRYIDFNTEGRGISRKDILDKAALAKGKINSLLEITKAVSPENTAVIDAAKERISQNKFPDYSVSPTHSFFWKADYTQHIRPAYNFNVRTVSLRTKRTEAGNKENLLGKFLPDGSTNIQRRGEEYFNVMPVWEWDKIPGITSRDFKEDQPITVQWGEAGSTNFVGGVSDSIYGTTCYDMDYNDVKAKKAWFFFDKEVVCLGAGINSNTEENITTTINQSWLNGKIAAGENDKIITIKKENSFAALQWLWQDSIGYYFQQPQSITVSNTLQTGSWSAINGSGSKEITEGKVFKAWINHGVKPVDSTYTYIVVPGVSAEEMKSIHINENIKVISNTKNVQAVYHNGIDHLQAIFYQPGELRMNGFYLKTDGACALLIKKINSKEPEVWIADPGQKQKEITLQIQTGNSSQLKEIKCKLPEGNLAGASKKLI